MIMQFLTPPQHLNLTTWVRHPLGANLLLLLTPVARRRPASPGPDHDRGRGGRPGQTEAAPLQRPPHRCRVVAEHVAGAGSAAFGIRSGLGDRRVVGVEAQAGPQLAGVARIGPVGGLPVAQEDARSLQVSRLCI